MPCKNKTSHESRVTSHVIIAIDGPAGSGKSTVAKELAKRLGYLYVDTGSMYRALTLKAIQAQINLTDAQALIQLARRTDIRLKMQGASLQVKLDGKDVSKAIRKQSLTENVHHLARVPGVRREMVKLQRSLAKTVKGAVLEGRDIGTVVFPNAKYKFYLDAKPGKRVKRRYQELIGQGQKVDIQEVARDIKRRDKSDLTRDVAPLAKARDAICIDTTSLAVEQVVEQIVRRCFIP